MDAYLEVCWEEKTFFEEFGLSFLPFFKKSAIGSNDSITDELGSFQQPEEIRCVHEYVPIKPYGFMELRAWDADKFLNYHLFLLAEKTHGYVPLQHSMENVERSM